MSSVASCHIAFISDAFQAASHRSYTALIFATALSLLIVGIGSTPRIERGIVASWIGLARLLEVCSGAFSEVGGRIRHVRLALKEQTSFIRPRMSAMCQNQKLQLSPRAFSEAK